MTMTDHAKDLGIKLTDGETEMEVQYYGFTLSVMWLLVDPERAKGLLAINNRNRSPKLGQIRKYALDMSSSNWIWNGSTICVSAGPEHVLLDGQNRLMAIRDSGESVWSLVVVGLPLAAQDEMDNGSSRSFGDTLKIAGERNYTELASLVRLDIAYQAGVLHVASDRGGTSRSYSRSQMQRHLDLHPEIRDTIGIASQARRKLDVANQYANLAALIFYRIDEADCRDFFSKLGSIGSCGANDPISVLQNTLINAQAEKRRGRPMATNLKLAYIIKAWNAYRTGQSIKILKFKPGGANPDKFPTPV
jgi:hypothetical protein